MFASSKPCPGEVRNEMFVYSKKFSSNCDYWRGLLRHISNVLNGEYNIWRWCLLVPTSFGKHLPALSQITNGHLKVVSILKCVDACLSTKLLLTGMMSSKDHKNILTVKIFGDKQTKFRCQHLLHVSGFIEETHNCRLCPCSAWSPSSNHNHVSVFIAQRSNNIHCSLITVSCYHSPSWHPRILDTVLQLPLTPALADTCVVWNIDVNILWRRQIKFIVCIFQSNSIALGYGRKVAAALKSLQRQTRMILSVPLSDHIFRLLINDM